MQSKFTRTWHNSALHELWTHVHMLWSDCDLIALSQWLMYNRGPHTRSWVDRQATYSIQTSQWDCQTQEMTYDVSACKSTTSQRDWKGALGGGELMCDSVSAVGWRVVGAGLPGKRVYHGSIRCEETANEAAQEPEKRRETLGRMKETLGVSFRVLVWCDTLCEWSTAIKDIW